MRVPARVIGSIRTRCTSPGVSPEITWTQASDGVARTRATIWLTLATIPPVTSTPREPPSASCEQGQCRRRDLVDHFALDAAARIGGQHAGTSPTSTTRCGCSRGASQPKISSVEMMVPPRTSSSATSP